VAVTDFQRTVCRLLAAQRVRSGDSYVAGGTALGEATASSRLSRDIDVFHDTTEAVGRCWDADRGLLAAEGFQVDVVRERPSFVEAVVSRSIDRVLVQWAADSAYRFFPLVEHDDFGLTLHPFDLATNKVLALVGRLEARDWVDVLDAHERIQEFGLLAWAACGKDPGFGPVTILEQAARSARYSEDEIAALDFEGPSPSAAQLSRRWHAAIDDARQIVAALPAKFAGCCVTDVSGALWRGNSGALRSASAAGALRFRSGSVRGVLPSVSAPA
jgi:hypothetical protein